MDLVSELEVSPQYLRDAIEIEMQKNDDPKQAAIIAIQKIKSNKSYYQEHYGLVDFSDMTKAGNERSNHKYLFRKPDGKGGWNYIYKEDVNKKKKIIQKIKKEDSKDQTQTENFKKWFGDSKVVDENGKPLVVYHGTTASFNEFKAGGSANMIGGIYFTPDSKLAFGYTETDHPIGEKKVISAYVSIKNPAPHDVIKSLKGLYGFDRMRKLQSMGYDGVIDFFPNEIIAFSPSQIKSATGNNGNFDPKNSDMTKATQLQIGTKLESEHKETFQFIKQYLKDHGKLPPEQEVYKHIAENHLDEFKNYYTKLIEMESKMKKEDMKKARNTKYIKKIPDGKGGFRYIYENNNEHNKQELNNGSYLDNKKIPKTGEKVFFLKGQFGDNVDSGIIDTITNIDNKGLSNTYLNIKDKNGNNHHINIAQVYDHKPKKIEIEDQYGKVKMWKAMFFSMLKGEHKGPHKYYKKIPKPTGKGFLYFYTKDQYDQYSKKEKKNEAEESTTFNVLSIIKNLFGLQTESDAKNKIKQDYKNKEIETKYSISLQDYANHIREYFMNKDIWSAFVDRSKLPDNTQKSKISIPVKIGIIKDLHREYGNMEPVKAVESVPVQAAPENSEIQSEGGYSIGESVIYKNGETVKIVKIRKGTVDRDYNGRKVNDPYSIVFYTVEFPDGEKQTVGIEDFKKISENNFETMPESEPAKEVQAQTKDKEIVKEISDAKPDNRAETEAKILNLPKEPWAITFNEYKKQLMEFRDASIIKQLQNRIEFYKKQLLRKNEIHGNVEIWENGIKSNTSVYETYLEKFLSGEIDDRLKPNPSWDYLQKQYDQLKNKESDEGKSLRRKLNGRENKARTEHARLINNAIKNGKVVPANVLKEYPELQEESKNIIQTPDINYIPTETTRDIYVEGVVSEQNKRTLKIKDYSQISAKDVFLANEENILNVPRPSYIPEMNLDDFAGYQGRNQNFDVARIGVNQYIIVDKRYSYQKNTGWRTRNMPIIKEDEERDHISDSNYFLMNAETLAATWDYYRKLFKATEIKKHEEKQDREEAHYNTQKAKMLASGRDWPYAPFKRKGVRPKEAQPDSNRMSLSQGRFIQDIEGRTGSIDDMRKGLLNMQVFTNYQTMLRELEYKINDLRMQKAYDDENNTYSKGEETSYGDSGLKNDLLKSYGVKVKRQNGTEIDDQDIAKIGMVLEDIYSVFGNRKSMSEKYGLKISYAGEKRMHASKAIGFFIQQRKCIAISDTGISGRGFTVAHEFAHFIDSYLGEKIGNHHVSDQEGHLASDIAKKFRNNFVLSDKVGPQAAQYYNRTCECFARAMEQYYSIKQDVQNELYETQNKSGAYVRHDFFVKEIMPMCEKFLTENDTLLKAIKNNMVDLLTKNQIIKRFNSETHQFEYIRKK